MSEWGLFLDRGSTPRSSTKSRTAERLRSVFLWLLGKGQIIAGEGQR